MSSSDSSEDSCSSSGADWKLLLDSGLVGDEELGLDSGSDSESDGRRMRLRGVVVLGVTAGSATGRDGSVRGRGVTGGERPRREPPVTVRSSCTPEMVETEVTVPQRLRLPVGVEPELNTVTRGLPDAICRGGYAERPVQQGSLT